MSRLARQTRRRSPKGTAKRRGAIAILFAVALLIVLAMMAMSIDIGFVHFVRTEMQGAADAAALAAVGEMVNGRSAARQTGETYVSMNLPRVNTKDIETEVELGYWDRDLRNFVKDREPLNAVRVLTTRTNAPLFLANAMGRDSFEMKASAIATYQPRDIMLVLDYSGSMNSQNKIGALKDAVEVFVSYLQQSRANDRVGFAIYSTEGEMAQPLTFDLTRVERNVRSREADGWTNMGEGMQFGLDELKRNARPGAKRIMLVMTDGKANRPTNLDPKQYVIDQANEASRDAIPVVAISFSKESDRKIMRDVAEITAGVHYHVAGSVSQQERELKRVFREVAANRPLALVD